MLLLLYSGVPEGLGWLLLLSYSAREYQLSPSPYELPKGACKVLLLVCLSQLFLV